MNSDFCAIAPFIKNKFRILLLIKKALDDEIEWIRDFFELNKF